MKRLTYIDILKGIAIIFIVFGHAIVHSLNSHIAFKIIYSFHVPLFFIISGFTFESANKHFLPFLKNKIMRILIPYLIWSLMFLIPYYIFGRNVDESFGNTGTFNLMVNLYNVVYGVGSSAALKQNTPLWFLPALFTMELIFYFICKLQNKRSYIFIITMLLLLSIISYKYISIVFPFGFNSFMNLGVFFYFGFLLKKYDLIDKIYQKKYFYMIVFIVGIIAGIVNDSISCVDYYYGNIYLFYLSSVSLSLCVINISRYIYNNMILEYIGKNTMGILIFHKLIIVVFQNKIPYISSLLRNSNFVVEFLLGGLISVVTIVICLFIVKIIKILNVNFLIGEKPLNVLKKM